MSIHFILHQREGGLDIYFCHKQQHIHVSISTFIYVNPSVFGVYKEGLG